MKELRILVEDRAGEFAITLIELFHDDADDKYTRYHDIYDVDKIRLNIVGKDGMEEVDLTFEPKEVQNGR